MKTRGPASDECLDRLLETMVRLALFDFKRVHLVLVAYSFEPGLWRHVLGQQAACDCSIWLVVFRAGYILVLFFCFYSLC
jgi:hypothetical protein